MSPLQFSCLENPMDRGAWRATVYRVPKSQTPLKNWACMYVILMQSVQNKYFAKNKFIKNIFSFAYQDFKLRKPDIIWQTLENIFNINLYKLQLIVSNILTTKKNKVNCLVTKILKALYIFLFDASQ